MRSIDNSSCFFSKASSLPRDRRAQGDQPLAFDLQTVPDTLAISASRLCDADRSRIFQKQGEVCRRVSNFGFSREIIAYADAHPLARGRGAQRRVTETCASL
jgi:hypothetical protein